ncbi:hypothetical protein AC1031_015970 [Aphanomyces cochlioides]|nr:hypothetical protein AC1031_015970 [Aphanomyces cochlioides]
MDDASVSFEWREPMRLCTSTGKDWPCQGVDGLAASLVYPLVTYYNVWKDHRPDIQNYALNFVVGGPGTGKSRMFDEIATVLENFAQWYRGFHTKPTSLVKIVYDELSDQYHSLFHSDLFEDSLIRQRVLATVLSRPKCLLETTLGHSGWTVEKLCSLGLFRHTNGRFECANVFLIKLLGQIIEVEDEKYSIFDEDLQSAFMFNGSHSNNSWCCSFVSN